MPPHPSNSHFVLLGGTIPCTKCEEWLGGAPQPPAPSSFSFRPKIAFEFPMPLHRECLNTSWFLSVEEAQKQLNAWRQEYNVSRPHRALQDQTPVEFANHHAEKDKIEEVKPVRIFALQLAQKKEN